MVQMRPFDGQWGLQKTSGVSSNSPSIMPQLVRNLYATYTQLDLNYASTHVGILAEAAMLALSLCRFVAATKLKALWLSATNNMWIYAIIWSKWGCDRMDE